MQEEKVAIQERHLVGGVPPWICVTNRDSSRHGITSVLPTILSESRDLRVDTFGLALYSLFPMFSCAQNFVCCLCCRALVSSGAGRITL